MSGWLRSLPWMVLLITGPHDAEADERAQRLPSDPPEVTTEILDTLENRPRRSLNASASQRRDYLANKEAWVIKPNYTLHKLLELPEWASLTIEERFRYETYATPWMKNNTQGQWSVPMQSVVFGEVRPSEAVRFGAEFWDARQWGSSTPNKINVSMVNPLNFSQIYGAFVDRRVLDLPVDAELKAGQMTLSLGSTRLIGRSAFRNTLQSYVGIEGRLRAILGDFELHGFATTPEDLLPSSRNALLANDMVWNRPIAGAYFAGLFLTKHLTSKDRIEGYYYDLGRPTKDNIPETFHTPGLRIYREVQKEGFDYEIEVVGQFGDQRVAPGGIGLTQSFGATMEHLQLAHSWDASWRPRLQIEWDYASPRFNPLYGINVIDFGPSGILNLFERTNINSPAWRFLFNPDKDVFVYFVQRFWWLADGRSPVGWTNARLVDTSGRSGSYVGDSLELSGRWDLAYNVAFQAGWQILMKGRFAETAPGAPTDHSNVNYFFFETQFRL